jgi:hypothetical protein
VLKDDKAVRSPGKRGCLGVTQTCAEGDLAALGDKLISEGLCKLLKGGPTRKKRETMSLQSFPELQDESADRRGWYGLRAHTHTHTHNSKGKDISGEEDAR